MYPWTYQPPEIPPWNDPETRRFESFLCTLSVRSFQPMSDVEKTTLLTQVKDEAGDGRHELFKSAKTYDGPHHRRQHGFAAG